MPDAQTARLTLSRAMTVDRALFDSPEARAAGSQLAVPLPGYGVGLYTLCTWTPMVAGR